MSTCSHGVDPMFCKDCRAADRAASRERIKSGKWVYAVLPHRDDLDYRIEHSVALYKSFAAARRRATKEGCTDLAPRGYVVWMLPTSSSKGRE